MCRLCCCVWLARLCVCSDSWTVLNIFYLFICYYCYINSVEIVQQNILVKYPAATVCAVWFSAVRFGILDCWRRQMNIIPIQSNMYLLCNKWRLNTPVRCRPIDNEGLSHIRDSLRATSPSWIITVNALCNSPARSSEPKSGRQLMRRILSAECWMSIPFLVFSSAAPNTSLYY